MYYVKHLLLCSFVISVLSLGCGCSSSSDAQPGQQDLQQTRAILREMHIARAGLILDQPRAEVRDSVLRIHLKAALERQGMSAEAFREVMDYLQTTPPAYQEMYDSVFNDINIELTRKGGRLQDLDPPEPEANSAPSAR